MKLVQRVVSFLAAVLMFALMMLTLADVVGRNLFNHPLRGATELTEIALVMLSFLLFPVVAYAGKHIVADVADVFESRVLDLIQHLLTAVLGSGFFGVVAWRLWTMAERAAGYGDTSVSLRIPMAPVFYVISVLAAITAVAFLLPLRKHLKRAPAREHVPTDSLL